MLSAVPDFDSLSVWVQWLQNNTSNPQIYAVFFLVQVSIHVPGYSQQNHATDFPQNTGLSNPSDSVLFLKGKIWWQCKFSKEINVWLLIFLCWRHHRSFIDHFLQVKWENVHVISQKALKLDWSYNIKRLCAMFVLVATFHMGLRIFICSFQ